MLGVTCVIVLNVTWLFTRALVWMFDDCHYMPYEYKHSQTLDDEVATPLLPEFHFETQTPEGLRRSVSSCLWCLALPGFVLFEFDCCVPLLCVNNLHDVMISAVFTATTSLTLFFLCQPVSTTVVWSQSSKIGSKHP